jgi:hypothetical protein
MAVTSDDPRGSMTVNVEQAMQIGTEPFNDRAIMPSRDDAEGSPAAQ